MNLIRFIICDIVNGIIREWRKYLIVFCVFLLFAFSLFVKNENYETSRTFLTFGDYILNVFAGMKEYVFDPQNPFSFPALWMLLVLLISYITLYYPYKDLMGIGKHMMIVSGSRTVWWVSKCIWIVVSVFIYYIVGLLATCIWVAIFGNKFSMEISQIVPELLKFDESILVSSPWEIKNIMILLPILTFAVCLVQMLISLLIKPIFSYIITVAVMFFSAYLQKPFLIGNYIMAARSEEFVAQGMNLHMGLTLSTCIIIFVILVGGAVFRKIDIINWEN